MRDNKTDHSKKSPIKRAMITLTCIMEDCTNEQYCRGLCRPCYRAATKQVAAGRTTWRELEQKGLCLKTGRGYSAFTKRIKGIRE